MSHLLVAALTAWRVLASTPDGRRYGELMRSEVTATGEVERARLRIWMEPFRSLDTRACPDGSTSEHFRCWCERVCGLPGGRALHAHHMPGAGGPGSGGSSWDSFADACSARPTRLLRHTTPRSAWNPNAIAWAVRLAAITSAA